jgi:isoleucyl-tRNA synthetase
MFKPVDTRQSFPKLEEEIIRFWKEHDTFRKSVDQRPADRQFIFYEGPPYANAAPGVHHILPRVFKDVIVRYKTMRGYRVPRRAGWDTHGLPAELEVERELGIKNKAEIEERVGIEEFNRRCRENVMRYLRDHETLTERIAFWEDLENAYVTFRSEYIESVWWIIKQLWDKGLVYLDYRSTPHCPRCGTSLSDHEVAQGYREDTPDPSVYVKFRALPTGALRDALPSEYDPAYFVAWTTTPWTLPGNTALAVDPEADYAVAELEGDYFVVAAALAEKALGPEHRVVATLKGRVLVDSHYEALYEATNWGVQAMWFDPAQDGRLVPVDDPAGVEMAYTVLAADFVSMEDGSGIVHIAPAFGGEDFEMGKEKGLLFLQPVDLRGRLPEGSPWPAQFVKEADKGITADLDARGLLLRSETIRHTYPFCWRCATPLLYYAKPTWYIRTTAVKQSLLEGNDRINWYPDHIKNGRFGDWLRNNVDWALSRERYWGIGLPIWHCSSCSNYECVGSLQELADKAVDRAQGEALDDLHRPYIDRIELRCHCGGAMTRVPELIDVWFDSGAMPYAQWHYPFEHREEFERSFPADFICEGVDQTRGWFYTLHAEATLLHAAGAVPESISYRNVLCLELILDDKGEKMSKSKGNIVEPIPVLDAHGADAMRWYMFTASPPWVPRRFSEKLVAESLRRFLLTLWNTYSFFVTYANLDSFDPRASGEGKRSELDHWLVSELNALVQKVTDNLENYNPTTAGRAIQDFVDDLSNWYVRRSRRRFWKSGADADKFAAYHTLYQALVSVTKLLAPFTPFVSEAMYQNLVRSPDGEAPESIHLAAWPEANESLVDRRLMAETRTVMRVVSLGRAARSKAGIKVRQPLATAYAFARDAQEVAGLNRLEPQVLDELNVKRLEVIDTSQAFAGRNAVEHPKDLLALLPEGAALAEDDAGYAVGLDTRLTPELADEGLARELVHRIQNMRKAAGFEISDRIIIYHDDSERLRYLLAAHGPYVQEETLANSIQSGHAPDGAFSEQQTLDGEAVTLAVQRAE